MKFHNRPRMLYIFGICVVLIFGRLPAQDGQGGTESNLSMGFGARALGLGSAFTALSNDPSAVFWNPSGLEYVYRQSVTFFHTTLFEGASYDFLSYALPTLNLGTFGVGLGRIGIGGIKQTDIQKNDLGTFSWDEYQAFFAYAKKLPWNLSSGLTVRVIRRAWNNLFEEGDLTDYGVGLDFGLMYKPAMFNNVLLKDWSIGFMARNLFKPQLKEGNNIDELPLSVRLGFMRPVYFGEGNKLNILFDLDHSSRRDMRFHIGTEYLFRSLGSLRLGLNGNRPTFGAGLRYSMFEIDYAFGNTAYSDVFPAMHRFSLSVQFGMDRDQLAAIAEEKRRQEQERIIADMREADRQKFVNDHLQTAEQYFSEGRYLDAIVEYQQVISQDPFNNRANVMIDSSDALLQEQFAEQRRSAVQEALDKERAQSDREFVNEHFEKGRSYLNNNQFTEALIEFNMALERAPGDETITSAISTTQRRIDEELTRLLTQIRQEFQAGNYPEALRLAAVARLLGGENQQLQNEIDALSQRIKLQDYIQKGLEFLRNQDFDKALDVFGQALEISPDNELARQYYDRAKIETLGRDEKMDAESEKRYLQGVDNFVKGRYQEAINIWEELLQKYPYNKKLLKDIEGARERLNKQK